MNWLSVFFLWLSLAPLSLSAFPFLYVAQNDGSSSIFNIAVPSAPSYQSSASNLQAFAMTLSCCNRCIYGPTSNEGLLYLWDFTNPNQPVFVQNAPGNSLPWGALVPIDNPNFWVPGGGVNIFSVYPMFDPANPGGPVAPLQSIDFFAMYPDMPFLYTLQNNALVTYNVADPANPILESSIPITSSHLILHPTGSNLYVVDSANLQLAVFDLSSPTSPTLLSTNLSIGANPQMAVIEPSGNYLYVANQGDNSLSIFNIQTPSAPLAEPTFTSPNLSQPSSLICSPDGSSLYVGNQGASSISVLNIQVQAAPVWIQDLSVSQVPSFMTINTPYPYPFARVRG